LWSGIFSINGSEQSPRYFNARSFGLRIADQSGRAIAIDLPELVLIYKPIAPGASIAGLSCQRPKNRKNCRGGHHGKSDPKCHYARRLSLSAKALLRQGGPFRLPARVLMVTPPARLHHGANTAAMGVRARQFRTAVVGLPQWLGTEQAAGTLIVTRQRKPRSAAYSKRLALDRRKRLVR